jgi:hypothetical protein
MVKLWSLGELRWTGGVFFILFTSSLSIYTRAANMFFILFTSSLSIDTRAANMILGYGHGYL